MNFSRGALDKINHRVCGEITGASRCGGMGVLNPPPFSPLLSTCMHLFWHRPIYICVHVFIYMHMCARMYFYMCIYVWAFAYMYDNVTIYIVFQHLGLIEGLPAM